MVSESILVAFISGGLALLGTIVSNFSIHSKTMYRIEQLEKKQDLHNSVITRVYEVEKAVELLDQRQHVADHRIDDLEGADKNGR